MDESKYLWELLVGYVKRDLLILDGFVYVLEQNGNCRFVADIWSLEGLFRVYYDSAYESVRMVFTENGQPKNRDFRTKYKKGFFDRLQSELEKIGRRMQ